jgi:RHS repeat-associated protein
VGTCKRLCSLHTAAAGNAAATFSYDPNSNRLTSINKVTSDTDLDGDFDQFDKASSTAQTLAIGSGTNKLLGFSQTLTSTKGTKTLSTSSQQVNYQLDAAGNLTSDGLRTFAYDATNRHTQTTVSKDGEASKITYLHNALGQRVFKSEPQTAQTLPNETVLGTSFTNWLKTNFSWLYATAQTNATLGNSYVYADGQLPEYAMLGEYGNGGTTSTGRTEYLWLPTENGSGQAIPVGLFRSNRFYAVHADHLNTPRLINDDSNKAVWQWPYSAFGDNQPVGILKATTNPANAYTQDPTTNARLQATAAAITFNLRYPGQYSDSESGMFYNTQRSYLAGQGRYSQSDPIGLGGGRNRFVYTSANPLGSVDPLGLVEYIGLDAIRVHLETLARAQGDNFSKDRWFGPERDMLDRLRRGEGTASDVAFYHHEKAESDMCRPYLGSSTGEFLKKQKAAHDLIERNQGNTQIDRYHPEVRRRYSDLFPLR